MRKVLQATLPLLTIVVICASFFLLAKQQHDSRKVLGASGLAATTIQKPTMAKILIKQKIATSSAPIKSRVTSLNHQPTDKPTPTPTLIKSEPKPTALPTPTPTFIKSEPTSTPIPVSSGDTHQNYIIQKINDYRSSQGLGSVGTDSNSCSFAKTRAGEITQSFNHDGFRNRISAKTLPYGSYHEVTENIAMTSDYTQVVTMWINSPGHAENMRKDTPFVCVEKSGNYYAYEGYKP